MTEQQQYLSEIETRIQLEVAYILTQRLQTIKTTQMIKLIETEVKNLYLDTESLKQMRRNTRDETPERILLDLVIILNEKEDVIYEKIFDECVMNI